MTHDHGVARKIAWHGNDPSNPQLTRGHSWKPLHCWKCCKNIDVPDPTKAPLHRPSNDGSSHRHLQPPRCKAMKHEAHRPSIPIFNAEIIYEENCKHCPSARRAKASKSVANSCHEAESSRDCNASIQHTESRMGPRP